MSVTIVSTLHTVDKLTGLPRFEWTSVFGHDPDGAHGRAPKVEESVRELLHNYTTNQLLTLVAELRSKEAE